MAIFNKNKNCNKRDSYFDFLLFVAFLLVVAAVTGTIGTKFSRHEQVISNGKYDIIDIVSTYYVKDRDSDNIYIAIVNEHNAVTYYRLVNDDDTYADIKDIIYTLNKED